MHSGWQRIKADRSQAQQYLTTEGSSLPLVALLQKRFLYLVVPNAAFGILGAISGPCLTTQDSPIAMKLLQRLPLVILFNWSNVLIFALADQRLPEAVVEDRANKSWRPLPIGRVSSEQTWRLMLIAIPLVLALTFAMGVW